MFHPISPIGLGTWMKHISLSLSLSLTVWPKADFQFHAFPADWPHLIRQSHYGGCRCKEDPEPQHEVGTGQSAAMRAIQSRWVRQGPVQGCE